MTLNLNNILSIGFFDTQSNWLNDGLITEKVDHMPSLVMKKV